MFIFSSSPQLLEIIILTLPLSVGCSKSMWHIKIFSREPVEFLCEFSPRAQNFKKFCSFLPWGNFPEIKTTGLLCNLFKSSSRHFLWPCSLFYEFSHSYPNSFQKVSAQNFTSDCLTTISESTSGFPALSDGANCLQIQEPLQPEKTGSLEMEDLRDHRASYGDQGDIACINFHRSEEN